MSPRARFSDLGVEVLAPVGALALTSGSASLRTSPANDTSATGRLDLLAQRRRRQNRRELRS